MWEKDMDVNAITELRCKTTLYLGVGAIERADNICEDLVARGIDRVMVVASRSAYKKC